MDNASGSWDRPKIPLLLRLAIIVGVVCALPVVGLLSSKSSMLPILLIVASTAPIGIFWLLKHIELGLVAMLLSAVFMAFSLPTGTASRIVISLLLCGAVFGIWVLRMITVEKRLKLKPAPINFPLLAFMAIVLVSLLWSRVYRDPLVLNFGSSFVAIASAAVMIMLPMTLLLVANLVEDERWVQAMVRIFVGEGLVSLFLSLIIDLGIGPTDLLRRLVFHNGLVRINMHGLFSMWYVALSLALVFFYKRLTRRQRVVLLLQVAGWVYWGFFLRIDWLSGWIPTFVVIAALSILRSKKTIVVLLIFLVVVGRYYWQTSFQTESEESGDTRLAAYEVNWRVTGKHLIFGTGPAGYAAYYMTYFPFEGMATHSNYIDIVSQTGIFGMLFILWFFGAQLQGAYRLRQQVRDRGDLDESLTAAIMAGTLGCMVAMALGDWLFPFAYTQGIVGFDAAMINWFFMGLLWSLKHRLAAQAPLTSKAQTKEASS